MLLARGEASYLLFHRGLTHSLLGLLTLPPLLALGLWWALRRRTRLAWLCLVSWAGAILHVAYDLVTPWGTMLLYPLSHDRFAFDWLYIVDFVTWTLPMLALVVSWRRPAWARAAAGSFLVTVGLYAAGSGFVHREVLGATIRAERESDRPLLEAAAFPELGAPWRWQGLAANAPTGAVQWISRYAVTGAPPRARLEDRVERGFDDPWAQRALATRDGQAYLWWARVPVARVSEYGDRVTVTLSDLRFGPRPGGDSPSEMPFSARFTFDRATGAFRDVEW